MKRERRRTLLWQAKGCASRILKNAFDADMDLSPYCNTEEEEGVFQNEIIRIAGRIDKGKV